jgi:hydroxyethylthiazole kinase-like uncharacterized protein yjeF
MHTLQSVAAIRAIEQTAQAALPAGALMLRAGAAAAQAALALLTIPPHLATILVLAGPGNNGGDALDAARHLAEAGAIVHVLLCGDPARLPADAHQALLRARAAPVSFCHEAPSLGWSLVIDGLFGIGLKRAIDEPLRALVHAINALHCPVLALDVPSGLDADTGAIVGNDGIAVHASHTITFIADKPGLHTAAGREQAGVVEVAALGLDPAGFPASPLMLSGPELFAHSARPRSHTSHKGSYGNVVVLGGANGMSGAVLLAARCALYAGAGRIYAAFAGTVPSHDVLHPELMCRAADGVDFAQSVVVVGPGLGTSAAAAAQLLRVLAAQTPLVIDADALNLLASESTLQIALDRHAAPLILTPHPLEAARLLKRSASAVQADRLAAAAELAQRRRAIIILKGSGTVIAHPDGRLAINPTGNPALATGGTGDVLAGLCGALLAQGWPDWEAALGAVWLHGHAADMLVAQGIGPIGVSASELLPQIRRALNACVSAR